MECLLAHKMMGLLLVEIFVRKAFTAEEMEKFGNEIKDQVVKTCKEIKGVEPHVWVTFRELVGLVRA